ncbi:ABC transporter permease [Brevibacillus humidisoli]|uniref:FtsX-like permease family protein n=1 Tax=Brevibacillus humidisoli TaxID=2895522 RepID=UPI001E3FB7D2|nr:ABC transporter permease [Brevibacillus humidisoli]UFJ43009.1 ABC transporter permease [Brevibacillus humidisoli]
MTFRQFAYNNVTRSKRTYAAFFFSSVFSVMIFFMYAMFIYHPGIEHGEIHSSAAKGMEAAEYIIYLFAFFFLFYSVSAFLKKRQKEFGILFIHGMSRRQRNKLIVLENLLIGILSILFGIALGMVFAKLFFLFAAFLLHTEPLPFYLPWKAIVLTSAAFFALFLVITILTILFLGKQQLIELLKGSKKPKSEPKASLWLSLLSAILIGLGYTAAILAEGAAVPILLFPVSLVVIVGTYFLFSQLSVYTIRRLKRNRRLYWNKTNIITLSDLAFRMKDNARMFFLVCIVSTVAFCAVGTLAAYAGSIRETAMASEPFAFSYTSTTDNPYVAEHLKMMEQSLEKNGSPYTKHSLIVRILDGGENRADTALIKLSDYNAFAQATDNEPFTLQSGEAIELNNTGMPSDRSSTITVNDETLQVDRQALNIVSNGSGTLYIVADEVYEQSKPSSELISTGYVVENWEETMSIAEEMMESISSADTGDAHFSARVIPYQQMRQMANTMLFVGLFVGILFFVASGSFLYFRLYTDLDSDKQQYRAITRIGLTERELSRIVTIQVALLFFVPIVIAIIHSAVAFVSLQNLLKMMFVTSIVQPTAIVLCSFLLVQFFYFLLIRGRYLHHLKQAIR